MPREDNTLNKILIHMGETRKGISNLETAVSGVQEELNTLNQGTVRRQECAQRHQNVTQSIDKVTDALDGIKGDVIAIRRQTGESHPVITPQLLRSADGKKGMKYWVSVGVGMTTLLGFLASVTWSVVAIGRYIEKVDRLANVSKQQQKEIKKEIGAVAKARPRVVYVEVPAKTETENRRRRRPRRYRQPTSDRQPASRRTAGGRRDTASGSP